MNTADDFAPYARLADELIEQATKDQLADVARLLALNIGYYHEKSGDVPQEILVRMVRAESLDAETKRLLLHGMQNLLSALAEVMGIEHEEIRQATIGFSDGSSGLTYANHRRNA